MTDCIDRQTAIDALEEQIKQCDKALGTFGISMKDEYAVKVEKASLMAFKEKLENIHAADVVAPVRCRDCKFRENDDFCTGRGFPYQLVPDDGFCDKEGEKDGRMKGNMMIALAAIYMFVIELLVTAAAFYMISIWTQLPVDNNSLWIGLCILAAATQSAMIAGATISITSIQK